VVKHCTWCNTLIHFPDLGDTIEALREPRERGCSQTCGNGQSAVACTTTRRVRGLHDRYEAIYWCGGCLAGWHEQFGQAKFDARFGHLLGGRS
jgi:hypothetical protein